MIRHRGELLRSIVNDGTAERFGVTAPAELRAAPVGGDPLLPVMLQVPVTADAGATTWPVYRERVADVLGSVIDRLAAEVDPPLAVPLYAANTVATVLTEAQIDVVAADRRIVVEFADLDPIREVTAMDRVGDEIGLTAFDADSESPHTGAGVRVALLDSGLDAQHPALHVVDQVQTCGEDSAVPGVHGTHCAGILASRDPQVRGVAPGVDIVDVKVLRASGVGKQQWIGQGVDAALDRGAHVLSMSLAFNHLPREVTGGHGWTCHDGTCPLCRAVDTAVLAGAVVVVAAGNEHQRCYEARTGRFGLAYDTELGCPGQSPRVITVGSHQRGTPLPAADSSSGPTAYGAQKPDLVAPGVGILSTVPLPRTAGGTADLTAGREAWFAVKSGTSMATPIVAGVCALLIERARRDGKPDDPATICAELLRDYVEPVGGPVNVMGAGRLRLR